MNIGIQNEALVGGDSFARSADGLRNEGFRIAISGVAGGIVTGTFDRPASGLTPHRVRPGMLVNFAEFLTLRGCQDLPGQVAGAIVVQSNVTILGSAASDALMGKCQISQISVDTAVSETVIWDERSGRVALVNQVVSMTGEQPDFHADDGADRPTLVDYTTDRLVPAVAEAAPRVDIPTTRRHQIFNAATKIFTEKGFEGATMREIGREAGLSIPTMYQYFKSKDDILELIFDTYLTKMEADLRGAILGKTSATERLIAAMNATFASLDAHYRQIRIMSHDTKSLRPAVRTNVINRMLKYLGIFTDIVAHGVRTGEFRPVDPELFANLLAMMCQVWIQRHWSVGRFGLEAVQTAAMDFALHALRPHAGGGASAGAQD